MRVVVLDARDVEGWSYGDGKRALYWTTVMDSGVGVMDGETEGEGDDAAI